VDAGPHLAVTGGEGGGLLVHRVAAQVSEGPAGVLVGEAEEQRGRPKVGGGRPRKEGRAERERQEDNHPPQAVGGATGRRSNRGAETTGGGGSGFRRNRAPPRSRSRATFQKAGAGAGAGRKGPAKLPDLRRVFRGPPGLCTMPPDGEPSEPCAPQ